MKKSSKRFLAIDFETANQNRDSACSIGLVKVENNRVVHQEARYIRPPYRNFQFTYIHGISWNDVVSEPTFATVWKDLRPHFEGIDFLVAHNAKFDASVLKACCLRYSIDPPQIPFQCTVEIARAQWSIYPTKLHDVCQSLGIPLQHHEALSDALACAKIMIAAQANRSFV